MNSPISYRIDAFRKKSGVNHTGLVLIQFQGDRVAKRWRSDYGRNGVEVKLISSLEDMEVAVIVTSFTATDDDEAKALISPDMPQYAAVGPNRSNCRDHVRAVANAAREAGHTVDQTVRLHMCFGAVITRPQHRQSIKSFAKQLLQTSTMCLCCLVPPRLWLACLLGQRLHLPWLEDFLLSLPCVL